MSIQRLEFGAFLRAIRNLDVKWPTLWPSGSIVFNPEIQMGGYQFSVSETFWNNYAWEHDDTVYPPNPNVSPKPTWGEIIASHRVVELNLFGETPPFEGVDSSTKTIRERPVTNEAGMVLNTEEGMNHLTALLDVSYEGYGGSATHWPIPVLSNAEKTDTTVLWTQRGAREFLHKVQRQVLEAKSAEAVLRERIEEQMVVVRDEHGGLGETGGQEEQDLSMPALVVQSAVQVDWMGSLGQVDASYAAGTGDAFVRRVRLVADTSAPSLFETGEVSTGAPSQRPTLIDGWRDGEEAIELTAAHGSVRLPGPGEWESVSETGSPYIGALPSSARAMLQDWIDGLSTADRSTAGAITLTLLRPRTAEEATEAKLMARETARDEAQRLIDEAETEMDAIIAGFDADAISDEIEDARVQYSEKISHVARQRRDFIVDAPNLRDQGHFSCDEQLDAIREIEKLRQLAIRKFAASVSADQAALEIAYDQAAAEINAVTVANAPTWTNRTGGADAALVPSVTPPEITLPSTGGTVVIDATNPAVDDLQSDQLAMTSVTGDPELAAAPAFSYPTASLGRQRVSIPITSTTTIKLVARNACGPSELTVRVVVGA